MTLEYFKDASVPNQFEIIVIIVSCKRFCATFLARKFYVCYGWLTLNYCATGWTYLCLYAAQLSSFDCRVISPICSLDFKLFFMGCIMIEVCVGNKKGIFKKRMTVLWPLTFQIRRTWHWLTLGTYADSQRMRKREHSR